MFISIRLKNFADQLKKINVPQEMILNKSQWNYISKHNVLNVNSPSIESNHIGTWTTY